MWPWLSAVALLAVPAVAWLLRRRLRQEQHRLRQQRRMLEAEIDRREQEMDAMLGRLKSLVVRMDRAGRVLWANPRARELLPIPDDGAQEPLSVAQMKRDPEWGARLQRALDALPASTPLPVLQVEGDGAGDSCSFALQLLPLGTGQALLLGNDISESLRQQEQRERLFVNLMHDLKTPLTSLIGYSDTLAAMGEIPEVRTESIAAIRRAARRVNRLLDGLLELARAGQGGRRGGVCDPRAVAEQVVEEARDYAGTRGVRLRLECSDGLPERVAMAGDACDRVLFNVVENAIRHAPEGSVVTIRLHATDGGVVLSVADVGCGVPGEKIPRLTERFFTLDGSRAGGGHGLGLAIVAEELERCGGRLEIRNNLPCGLLVTMAIPAALPPQER